MIDKTVDIDIEEPRLKARALMWCEMPYAEAGDMITVKMPFKKPDNLTGEIVVIFAERIPIPLDIADVLSFIEVRKRIG